MKIMLNELEKAQGRKQHLEGSIDMEGIRIPDLFFEKFAFNGQAEKEADLVVVQGDISGAIKTKCSKCVAPAEYIFDNSFEEQFSELPVEEESEIHFFQGGKIDLNPYLQQTILLEMPQVFTCKDTCKGLCPTCGTNWNVDSCSCNNERIDPRLADLALFFNKDEK